MFAMRFKKNTIHSFWRTVILPIDIHSAKTRVICCFVPFYKDVAPLVLCQNIIIRHLSFEIYFPLKSLQDELYFAVLTGNGARFFTSKFIKSAAKTMFSMFALRFKKNTLYPFWRILIFLIGVFSGQNAGYLLFCPFLQR
jgi:hypothetical protein